MFLVLSLYDFLLSRQVVESVNELAQIMKDLSVLVIDQVRFPCQLQTALIISSKKKIQTALIIIIIIIIIRKQMQTV